MGTFFTHYGTGEGGGRVAVEEKRWKRGGGREYSGNRGGPKEKSTKDANKSEFEFWIKTTHHWRGAFTDDVTNCQNFVFFT